MAFSPSAVANYFIRRAKDEGGYVDHLKLQKLVYLAHGWTLAILGRPLLNESVEAWRYGPVIRSLYRQLKRHGNLPILDLIDDRANRFRWPAPPVIDDPELVEILDRVWETNGPFTGVQLMNESHEPGKPWSVAFEAGRETIEDEDLKRYFTEKAASGDGASE